MNAHLRQRSPSEVIRRGYSDEEIHNVYSLGRLFLEGGAFRRAETVFRGLIEVAPEFMLARLGLAYVHLVAGEHETVLELSRDILRTNPTHPECMLLTVISSLSVGDLNAAGTYLGELKDEIEAQHITDSALIRLYRSQLVRFQSR